MSSQITSDKKSFAIWYCKSSNFFLIKTKKKDEIAKNFLTNLKKINTTDYSLLAISLYFAGFVFQYLSLQ